MTSLTEKLLAKKQADEAAKNAAFTGAAAGTVENGEVPVPSIAPTPPADNIPVDGISTATGEIAKDSDVATDDGKVKASVNATTDPNAIVGQATNAGSPLLGGIQTGMQGSVTNPSQMEDPNKTIANAGGVYEDTTSLMGKADAQLAAGIALNQASDEENRIAKEAYEGEQRRQRMLEGRPTQADLDADAEEDAPAGAYKNIRLNQFIDSVGNVVKHVKGWFHPRDEADAAQLDHYVSQGLVEAPAKTDKE